MKDKNNQILIGFVERMLNPAGFGAVIIEDFAGSGKSRSFGLSSQKGPLIVSDGVSEPQLEKWRFEKRDPGMTDPLMLEFSGTNGDLKMDAWAFEDSWQASIARIAARQQYRVLRTQLPFKKGKKEQVVFTGSLQQMEAQCHRDGLPESPIDEFAPVYRNLLFHYENRFETRTPSGMWVCCQDPRPFPLVGPIYRLFYYSRKDETHTQLAEGTAAQINWKYPRNRNGKDELDRFRKKEIVNGDYLYWMEARPVVGGNETCWTEVQDPRPQPPKFISVSAAPAVTASRMVASSAATRIPVVMSKKPDSERQFHTKLKDFGSLEKLIVGQ